MLNKTAAELSPDDHPLISAVNMSTGKRFRSHPTEVQEFYVSVKGRGSYWLVVSNEAVQKSITAHTHAQAFPQNVLSSCKSLCTRHGTLLTTFS